MKFYNAIYLAWLLFACNAFASDLSHPTNYCDQGEFWSERHGICLHNYYHTCANLDVNLDPKSNDTLLFKQLSQSMPRNREERLHQCVRIAIALPTKHFLALDCTGISDLSALYPLKKLVRVVLKNLKTIPSLDFLTDSRVLILVLNNFDRNVNLSVFTKINMTLKSLGLHNGDNDISPDTISHLNYLEMIDFAPGRSWVDALKNTGKVDTLLFGQGTYMESHRGNGAEYKVITSSDVSKR